MVMARYLVIGTLNEQFVCKNFPKTDLCYVKKQGVSELHNNNILG